MQNHNTLTAFARLALLAEAISTFASARRLLQRRKMHVKKISQLALRSDG
jgi:hypothetical protein